MSESIKSLDITSAQKVSYCIPLWLRDEQIRVNIALTSARLGPHYEIRSEVLALVCYGPSLTATWEEVRKFPFVMTCSGAHKFMIERGIIPQWHVDVDPREHKIALIGDPHSDVEYLLASTCHPNYFRKLINGGFNVKLWHVFDGQDEALRVLPPGEWALTGGCSVGLRMMAVAHFLGFRDFHIFGMDGNEDASGHKHAAEHPNEAKDRFITEYKGKSYYTTPSILEAARQTWHELDQLDGVKATFYGEGLVQEMAKDYVRKEPKITPLLSYTKPELISPEKRALEIQLHNDRLDYGVGGGKHSETITKLVESTGAKSILDYGCGKGYLAKALPFPIWEYDPAIPEKSMSPRPADVVVCTDVLEHIEPEKLDVVLMDLRRVVKQVGFFVVHMGAAKKKYADGRNTHLIQQTRQWWEATLARFFVIGKVWEIGKELYIVVGPSKAPVTPQKKVISAEHLFSFKEIELTHTPYTLGLIRNIMDIDLYYKLAGAWPSESLFKHLEGAYEKFSLSERNHPDAYRDFIKSSQLWSSVHFYIKNKLISDVLSMMLAQNLELPGGKLTARFEFSSLPANGGKIDPHTDIPSKVVTLIIPMRKQSDLWNMSWGGGTDILEPLHSDAILEDYKVPLSEFTRVVTYPYLPNQCVLFLKSQQSWHSVGPIQGPAGHMRRTLTINIEKS